jgi:hypothetical protein
VASTYFDLSAANFALKELYDGQIVNNEVYKENPFYTMVQKKTNFVGKVHPVPMIVGVSQGRSSTFANAQGNQTPLQGVEFLMTRKRDYSIATIDNETMLAAASDKGAFIEGAQTVIDAAIRASVLSLSSSMYRGGTGSIGQIATGGITSGVITLADPSAVVQFEIGQTLQAAATDGAAPRAALGYVVAVDRTAGTVSVAASQGGTAASPALWAAADFLLVQGDSNAKVSGLNAWLPASAPGSSDNYYGVNRSFDPVRMAGVRYNGAAQDIPEALIDAAGFVAREGGSPGLCFMSYASFQALEKALGAKVLYTQLGTDVADVGTISFSGIKINGPNGVITCLPDRNCPGFQAFMLTMSSWTLKTLGEAPMIIPYADGLQWLRVTNADAAEVRVGYYGNLECNAPGWNANITLSQ